MEREAEERVRAEMFQFPDDLDDGDAGGEPENEDVTGPAKIRLARKAERSESKDPAMLIGLIDEQECSILLKRGSIFWPKMEAMAGLVQKPQTILHAEHMIALKKGRNSSRCQATCVHGALIDEPGTVRNQLSEWQQF